MSKDDIDNIPEIEETEHKEPALFDVTGLFLAYLSAWKWFLLCGVLGLAIAYYYVSTIIPVYEVKASIYLNDEQKMAESESALGISANQNGDNMMPFIDETEIELLRSKNNLIKIVDSLGLAYSYYDIGHVRDIPVYRNSAVLVQLDSLSLNNLKTPLVVTIEKDGKGYKVSTKAYNESDSEKQTVKVTKLPAQIKTAQGVLTLTASPFTAKMNGTEKVVIRKPSTVAGILSSTLSMGFAKKSTSILSLSITTENPDEGRDVLEVLVDFYNRQMIEDKNKSAIQTEAFILDRLMMINGELRDVENRLREYREAHNIADLEAQTGMALSEQSNATSQIASIDAERTMLKDLASTVNRQDSYSMLPEISNNADLTASIQQYNQTVANYQRALETKGEAHPLIEKMQTDLNRQKSQIVSNISAAQREAQARRNSVQSLSSRSTGTLSAQPTIDKGLNEIFREQQVKVNIYTFLLQKREEIALQKTLATPTAQFIDNPSGGDLVSPIRIIYLLSGLLIGLLLPALIILFRRLIFPTFNDKDELVRLTDIPVIGEICRDSGDSSVVVGENVSTSIAELFRLLRNNINFTRGTGDRKVILITSSVSGEGKTFIAVNLAMTYALTGKRVIVVGLDIRRPVLAYLCGLNNSSGVTTYLSGQTQDLASLIHQSQFNPNMYILPAGPVPPNPNELLLNDTAGRMFDILRRDYDYVIVDSAPIGLVSDTLLISPLTDVQIYVTRAGMSTPKGLRVLHEAKQSGRLAHPYIVVNDVNVSSTSYIYRRYGVYGYYSKNSYGYGYGNNKNGHHSHHHHKKKPWYKRLFSQKTV